MVYCSGATLKLSMIDQSMILLTVSIWKSFGLFHLFVEEISSGSDRWKIPYRRQGHKSLLGVRVVLSRARETQHNTQAINTGTGKRNNAKTMTQWRRQQSHTDDGRHLPASVRHPFRHQDLSFLNPMTEK